MLFDLTPINLTFIMGFFLMFGLALLLTYFSKPTFQNFIIWLTISSGFIAWAGLIDLWVVVLNLILLTIILIYNLKGGVVKL